MVFAIVSAPIDASLGDRRLDSMKKGKLLLRVRAACKDGKPNNIHLLQYLGHNDRFLRSVKVDSAEGEFDLERSVWSVFCSECGPSTDSAHMVNVLMPYDLFTHREYRRAVNVQPYDGTHALNVDCATSLQMIFDFHHSQYADELISKGEFHIAAVLYLYSIILCAKAIQTDPSLHFFAPVADDFFRLVRENGAKRSLETLAAAWHLEESFAVSVCKTSFDTTQRSDEFRDVAISSGLYSLCAISDSTDVHLGAGFYTTKQRQWHVVKTILTLAEEVHVDNEDGAAFHVLRALLIGKDAVVRMLRIAARDLTPGVVEHCNVCSKPVMCSDLCFGFARASARDVTCKECVQTTPSTLDDDDEYAKMQRVAIHNIVCRVKSSRTLCHKTKDLKRAKEMLDSLSAVHEDKKAEADAAARTVRALEGQLARAEYEIATLKADLDAAKKEQRRHRKNSRVPTPTTSPTSVLDIDRAVEHATEDIRQEFVRSTERSDKEIGRLETERDEARAQRDRLGREVEVLKERLAQSDAHAERVTEKMSVADEEIRRLAHERDSVADALGSEIRSLDRELSDLVAFEFTRNDTLETQRAALESKTTEAAIMKSEMEASERLQAETVHLNSVWREKYAYASGQAKASREAFEALISKVDKLR